MSYITIRDYGEDRFIDDILKVKQMFLVVATPFLDINIAAAESLFAALGKSGK